LLAEHVLKKLNRTEEEATTLADNALKALQQYSFPGNVRELENILERAFTLCEGGLIQTDDLQLPIVKSKANSESINKPTADAPLENYLDTLEKEAIVKALEKTRWNKTAAAKELGITFRAVRYRLTKLGLDD